MTKYYTVLHGQLLTPERTFTRGEKVSQQDLADAGIKDKTLDVFLNNAAIEELEPHPSESDDEKAKAAADKAAADKAAADKATADANANKGK